MITTPDEAVNLDAAVERLRTLAQDCDYAAMPTKPDVVTLCGYYAGQTRDALRTVLSALSASNARALAAEEALREAQDTLIGAATRLRSFGRTTHEIDYEVERIEATLASVKENG